MICFCSDNDKIFAIDRTTGQTIWYVEMDPLGKKLDYLIGIRGDYLFAGGSETIVAIDLLGEGRLAWGGNELFDGGRSFGRAMLCDDALYVPVNDSIWKYTFGNDGLPAKASQAHVDLGGAMPVGNIFSDGQRIWIQGLTRVSAIEPKKKSE
jgi:hypothetical protein